MNSNNRTATFLLCLLGTACLIPGPVSAETFRVGIGSGCTHANAAAAIAAAVGNGPDGDLIRINAGTYSAQALVVEDHSLNITGGFADCLESTPTGAPTILSGAGNGALPVMSVSAPGAIQRTFGLTKLSLANGNAGGLRAIGNLQMYMAGVTITNNSAVEGGGIYVQGSSSQTAPNIQIGGYQSEPSRIVNNSATRGGGIHLDAFGFASISDARIANNTASVGAGIYLSGSGVQASLAGLPGASSLSGVRDNTASMDGGGVYLQSGASLSAARYFAASPVALIAGNSAGRNGGGVYMSNGGNSLLGYNLYLQNNTAGTSQNGNGGGIYMTAGNGALLADGGEITTCGRPEACVSIENNRAGINGFTGAGGGVYVLGGAAFTAFNARVTGNTAQFGGAAYAIGSNAQLRWVSSVIENNGGAGRSFQLEGGATLRLHGTTLGNDNSSQGIIGLSGGNAQIDTSIIYDPGAVILTRAAMTSNTVNSNCVLAHANYTSDTGSTMVGNPLFTDAASGDYKLQAGSPAIDACATSVLTTADTDYSEYPRGSDIPNVPNAPGPFDLGAFEVQAILFADSFE